MKKMLVSVVMITYNHENYIQESINSILMQKCNFDIELIISDDCSPDKTENIVRKILETHSGSLIINYIKHDNNIGMMPNFIFALKQCRGKYIALCEGDDYWIDSLKLQKQVDFLENNEEYILAFHPVKFLKPDGALVDDFITKVPENYEMQETLALLGNYIHTPSVVFRNVIKEFPPEFALSPVGDFFLYMLLTDHGKVKKLEDIMSVYRFGVGIHSTLTKLKLEKTNFKLFSLLLSYSSNPRINQILLERQLRTFDNLEHLIRNEYSEAFISHNIFFKAINSLQQPSKFWKKLKRKFK